MQNAGPTGFTGTTSSGPGLDTKKQISPGSNLISSAERLDDAVSESLLCTRIVLLLGFWALGQAGRGPQCGSSFPEPHG